MPACLFSLLLGYPFLYHLHSRSASVVAVLPFTSLHNCWLYFVWFILELASGCLIDINSTSKLGDSPLRRAKSPHSWLQAFPQLFLVPLSTKAFNLWLQSRCGCLGSQESYPFVAFDFVALVPNRSSSLHLANFRGSTWQIKRPYYLLWILSNIIKVYTHMDTVFFLLYLIIYEESF